MTTAKQERRPTYEMLDLLPLQGEWTVNEYLSIETNRLVEYTDGYLEFLPMPDEIHQDINAYIFDAVRAILRARGNGVAKHCPFKMKVSERSFREPDVCVLLDSASPHRGLKFWNSADLVFEVVSASNPDRDYEQKRRDYAAAGVAEYWIVDPHQRQITLLRLAGGEYEKLGVFVEGQTVQSQTLAGLEIDVRLCLAAGDHAAKNQEPTA